MPDAASINPCLCGARETQAALARIEADLSRREALGGTAAVLGMFAGFGLAPQFARAQIAGRPTLLANCSFFDGTTFKLHSGREIVVEGGKVSAIVGAGQEAGATLVRGFTTVRDTGGPVFGLKLAIDRGVLAGPRIFPSGAMLSQTSGMAISACSTPCRAWRAIRPTIPSAPGLQRSPMARPRCCAAPASS
jgi:hypothetical protein